MTKAWLTVSGFWIVAGLHAGCGGSTADELAGNAATGGAPSGTASVKTGGMATSTTAAAPANTGGDAAMGGTFSAETTVAPKCGDGTLESGETCDQGIYQGAPGCSANCDVQDPRYRCVTGQACILLGHCGNGTVEVQLGEDCEPQGLDDPTCTLECRLFGYCGDGVTQKADQEQCDYGSGHNTGGYGGCNSDCTLAEYCGDGFTEGPEECDFGAGQNVGDYGGCTAACKLGPYCGDGIVNGQLEVCDDGLGPNGNGSVASCCSSNCITNAVMDS